jgi:drug/metabolite transporter (DMT)-like permease
VSNLKPYLALVSLALLWGIAFALIKVAVHDMNPIVMVLIRATSGCLALALFVRAMGRPLFGEGWKARIVPYTFLGIAGGLLPWFGIAWGELQISSGLASILNATMPLWAAVLVWWVIPNERPSALNYAGVLIGFSGVVILVLPDLAAKGVGGNVVGALAVLLSAFVYAVGALYQRRNLRNVSVYEVSLGQMAATAILALPLAAPILPSTHVSLGSMAAVVVGLGVAGSGLGFLLYYYVMNTLGAVRGTGVTLLVPVTAVFWGLVLLHETLTLPTIVGMIVILAGVVLTNVQRSRRPAATRDSAAA